jgi:hypothetical protein
MASERKTGLGASFEVALSGLSSVRFAKAGIAQTISFQCVL